VTDGRPDRAEVEEQVLGYLRRELVDPDVTVARDTALLAGGVINSIAVLRLATFVAQEFGIEVRPADFVIENFRSVEAIASFVERARAERDDGGRP
jgi:acyl carrier protein